MGNTYRRTLPENNQRLLNNNVNVDIIDQNERRLSININQPMIKFPKAYKNPTLLKRNTLKLERDAVRQNIYYIIFEYDSLLDFTLNIYFNSTKIENSISLSESHFNVGQNFRDNIIKMTCEKGGNIKYSNSELFINMDNYFEKKISSDESFDVIIELIAFSPPQKLESSLATCFNISQEIVPNSSIDRRKIYKIKNIKQEILIEAEKRWLVMNDIFGVPGESASFECEICCTNKRNTIFLPCKHSYTCSNCSHSLRMRNNPCPICRNAITDFLFITQENEQIANNN